MRSLLAILLLINPPVYAKDLVLDPVVNQFEANLVLDQLFKTLEKIETPAQAEKFLFRKLSNRDQNDLRTTFNKIDKLPKFQRLNRGFQYSYRGQKFVFTMQDVGMRKWRVNGVDWSYQVDKPLKNQLEALAKKLNAPKTAMVDLLLPKADAFVFAIPEALWIGMFIGGVVAPLAGKIIDAIWGSGVVPAYLGWYCKDKDPNDYADSVRCADYFKQQERGRPQVPKASKVMTKDNPDPAKPVYSREECRTGTGKLQPVREMETADHSLRVRFTMIYGDDKDPKAMTEEFIRPPAPQITYTLNSDRQLLKVDNGKDLFLSRDPKDKERMDASKLNEMKIYDNALTAMISFTSYCIQMDDPSVAQAAGLPATKIVEQLANRVPAPHDPGAVQ